MQKFLLKTKIFCRSNRLLNKTNSDDQINSNRFNPVSCC